MKFILACILLLLLFIACRENAFVYPEENSSSKVIVESIPSGAYIYLANQYLGKVTPDTIYDVSPGEYSMRLKLSGFRDTSILVVVNPNNDVSLNVKLNSIYE
jgi:hypothetical protein